MNQPVRTLLEHGLPLGFVAVAIVLLVLSPFWALEWAREPFLGLFLEPNNIVSQIDEPDWPARQAGVAWSDQLVTINGHPVRNVNEVRRLLREHGFAPLRATFVTQQGEEYTLTLTPVRFSLGSLIRHFWIPYLTGLLFLLSGIWTYRIRPDLRASRAFLTFTAAVSVLTSAFLDMNTTHHVVLLWALSLSVSAGALAHLALVFPQPMPFVERRPILRYVPWLFVIALAIPTTREILWPSSSLAYVNTWIAGYALIILAMLLFLTTLMVRIARSHSPIIRQQSRVIVFGSLIAFLPVLALYLIPIVLSPTVPEFQSAIFFPLQVFLPLSVTYAIIRYRLLDVDRILGQTLTYFLITLVALGCFYGLIALLSYFLERTLTPNDPLLIGLFVVVLAVGLNPLRNAMQQTLDRFFYRASADYRRILTHLSRRLAITPDLQQILHLLEEELSQALAPQLFVLYLYDDEHGAYFPHAMRQERLPSYSIDEPLIHYIHQQDEPFWLSSVGSLPDALRGYEHLTGFTIVPLDYEERLIGFFMLGPRLSGELYSSDDLDFLAAVAAQSTLALENARLFTNLRRTLNQTLEMKSLMDDIFASIATGVITTDIAHRITLFNRAAERILGIPVERVIGRRFEYVFPELSEDFRSLTQVALQNRTPIYLSEVRRVLPNRGELTLRISCAPLLNAYRQVTGATIFFEDMTEQRKLEAERERIRQTFGRVVAPRVRDRLLADPSNLRLDGIQQIVTILFADLCGFTSFSEKRDPATVFRVLNFYLSLAAEAVLEEEGTLDKFMGDSLLAIWNSPDQQPDHALRAVRAAWTILQHARNARRHLSDPAYHFDFRIGIATGPAMVGNVGTTELFNYTAIGDTVNIANRLQASAAPGQILLLHTTYDLVSGHLQAEALAPIYVRGREQAVQVYRVIHLI